MLVLSRKRGEGVQIELGEGVPASTPVGELFGAGPIEILVAQVVGNRVKLGVEADRRLVVLRSELRNRAKAEKRVASGSK